MDRKRGFPGHPLPTATRRHAGRGPLRAGDLPGRHPCAKLADRRRRCACRAEPGPGATRAALRSVLPPDHSCRPAPDPPRAAHADSGICCSPGLPPTTATATQSRLPGRPYRPAMRPLCFAQGSHGRVLRRGGVLRGLRCAVLLTSLNGRYFARHRSQCARERCTSFFYALDVGRDFVTRGQFWHTELLRTFLCPRYRAGLCDVSQTRRPSRFPVSMPSMSGGAFRLETLASGG
jgi:hypothetical protein